MFGRQTSLRGLIRSQHEEFMRLDERRAEEAQQRAEESRQREARLEQIAEETREFNREMLLRNEKVYKAVIAEVEEGRKQIEANTKAVLSVLDRLGGSSGAAAA